MTDAPPARRADGALPPAGRARQAAALDRLLAPGILAGMVAAAVAGVFAVVVAGTVRHVGFFTPVYRVAALVDARALETSLEQARHGQPLWVEWEPLVFGTVMQLGVGAAFGALFALLVHWLRPPGRVALALGAGYGLVVMAVTRWLLEPAAAAAAAPGSPLAHLPGGAGWPAFTLQHLLFGLTLGFWVLARPQDVAPPGPRPA